MENELLVRWQEALESGEACVMVTVAATRGSVPRKAGAKMLIFSCDRSYGTIGGGKFESLVLEDAIQQLSVEEPCLKVYPLHEASADSFGAICGGEVTVLFEPLPPRVRLVIVGGGHCAQAIARLALLCCWHVTAIEDREEFSTQLPGVSYLSKTTPAAYIAEHRWGRNHALVLVARNYSIDQAALRAALQIQDLPYIGMIGSERKVRHVYSALSLAGDSLDRVYAPIGLDLGADSPPEIAVSVVAEIMSVLKKSKVGHLRLSPSNVHRDRPTGTSN